MYEVNPGIKIHMRHVRVVIHVCTQINQNKILFMTRK